MYERGVHATTLDDVREATSTSKSQLYRHFRSKDDLVNAVISLQSQRVLYRETARLEELHSFEGLVVWRAGVIQANPLEGRAYDFGLGSMADELASNHEVARTALALTFSKWELLIADGLRRMQAAGTLTSAASPAALATGLMVALQGGTLLAQTMRDITPVEIALDLALDHIRTRLIS
jgi:TetR/AcrR family transcriptional repressor of nem operon